MNFLRRRNPTSQWEDNLNEELRFHLEKQMALHICGGMSAEEARRQALLEFGGVESVKEECREHRKAFLLETLWTDLRYGLRMLRMNLGFTAIAVLTLALGIGANTAIFSVLDAVVLKPPPYPQADRLALIWTEMKSAGQSRAPSSGPDLLDIRHRAKLLQDAGGIWVGSAAVTGTGEPEQIKLGFTTANFLSLLGIPPATGRLFNAQDELENAGPVIIITDGLWRRKFGGDENIIGRSLNIDGRAATIVGVMPASFRLLFPEDASVPFSLQQDTTRDTQPSVLALFVGVGLVLLIACANVANLLLSRAGLRHREIALRATLGASRRRIIRQLLTESIFLSLLGGLAGLLLGWWGMKWLLALRPKSMVLLDAVKFNFPVLGYAFAISLLAGMIFGLAPSLEASKVNLNETLKAAGRGLIFAKQRYRTLLVTIEVALGFLLLVGAGLMTRTFARLINVDTGFQSDHVLTFQISPPGSRYPKDANRVRLISQLKKNLEGLQDVQSVGGVHLLPFDDYANWYSYYWLPGAAPQDQNTLLADHRSITPGFFQTLGIPLMDGRDFDEQDLATHRRVVIVDESLAKQMWPHQSAVGKELNVETIREGDFSRATAVVVGVVKHTKYLQLTGNGRPQIYEPYAQSTREIMAFAIRTKGEPQALCGAIRTEVAKFDTNLPVSKVRPMDEYVRMARASARFTMLLALALAGLALALASIGIYGVTSYSVAQRNNEIGIRMALGAQARDILKIVLAEGMAAVFAGVGFGLLLSLLVTPMLSSLLFGVRSMDALTFIAVALFLSTVGLLACCIPARRAMRVDPIVALRYE
jgi:cell division protein FtsX